MKIPNEAVEAAWDAAIECRILTDISLEAMQAALAAALPLVLAPLAEKWRNVPLPHGLAIVDAAHTTYTACADELEALYAPQQQEVGGE